MTPELARSRPDFSGRWVLDRNRSELQIDMPDASALEVNQRGLRVQVRRTHTRRGQSDTVEFELITDGAEREVEVSGTRVATTASWKGRELVIDMKIPLADHPAADFVQYSIKDDGQTLVALERWRSNSLQYDNLWVFVKG